VFADPTPNVPLSVQVIAPVLPRRAASRKSIRGGVIDTKVVLGGVFSVSVIPAVATAGPLFVTLWV